VPVQLPRRSTPTGVTLYFLLCLIWGSTWMVIKVGYGGLGPFNVAAVRFFIAGAVMAIVVPLVGARWPRGRTEWWLVGFVGLLMFAGDYGAIYWAEQFIDSGLTAILFATLPLLTIVAAHLYLPGERITMAKLAGTLLAFAGVIALFGDRATVADAQLGPMAAVIGAAVCAAIAGVATKRHGTDLHPAALNAPSMLIGAAVLVGASVLNGERFAMPADTATWGAVLYLALAGSVLAFLVYFSMLKTWTVTSLSFISVFTPAIALVLGFVVLDERPTLWTVVGAVLIVSGVALALFGTTVTPHDDRAGPSVRS
jgi:drug/metabolite transporter (DMT)-like permease